MDEEIVSKMLRKGGEFVEQLWKKDLYKEGERLLYKAMADHLRPIITRLTSTPDGNMALLISMTTSSIAIPL